MFANLNVRVILIVFIQILLSEQIFSSEFKQFTFWNKRAKGVHIFKVYKSGTLQVEFLNKKGILEKVNEYKLTESIHSVFDLDGSFSAEKVTFQRFLGNKRSYQIISYLRGTFNHAMANKQVIYDSKLGTTLYLNKKPDDNNKYLNRNTVLSDLPYLTSFQLAHIKPSHIFSSNGDIYFISKGRKKNQLILHKIASEQRKSKLLSLGKDFLIFMKINKFIEIGQEILIVINCMYRAPVGKIRRKTFLKRFVYSIKQEDLTVYNNIVIPAKFNMCEPITASLVQYKLLCKESNKYVLKSIDF